MWRLDEEDAMTSTLTAELLISVDGWAGSDGLPGYFGYLGPELEQWMAAESAAPHLALMGRKTYEVLSDLPDEAKDAEWENMTQQDTVVFSRTLTTVDWPNARVSDNLVVETTRLKDASDVPLRTVGSPTLVGQLVAAGLVDRLRLVTFPLFAGPDGREWAFTDIAAADLELVEHRVLDGRVLLAEYHPTGKDIPRA
jgi:dihydrofolate reductase